MILAPPADAAPVAAPLALQLAVGLLAGGLAAAAHLALLRRAVDRLLTTRRAAAALLGAPLRLAAPALTLLALARWSRAAALAGAVGLVLTEVSFRTRLSGHIRKDITS